MTSEDKREGRTAAEAGWHVSRYNVIAKVPETGGVVKQRRVMFRGAGEAKSEDFASGGGSTAVC